MKKIIVTTTINPPTKAIEKFDSMLDWQLVVIGDLKTPKNYKLKRGLYFNSESQYKYDKKLSNLIGWNCIQRRNFGLLIAHELKADIVAVVDDDNIPLPNWGKNLLVGKKVEVNYYKTQIPVFDPIGATNYPKLWHRGYPLQLLKRRDYSKKIKKLIKCDIQADFWNGDPDIDAVCRMEHAPECLFYEKYFPLASNKISPFNSQNTFIRGSILKDYFLFPHIGRMDDIWASFYLQAKGNNVVYGKPSVYQDRNVHDLIHDMKQEYLGYENNLNLINKLRINSKNITSFLPKKSALAFKFYQKHFKNA